ncbi:1541_t:CDS:2 [Funneliformis caledonium]|uniref:1541_t:CDS:1 n=1 Tax=Funneliformis caledonium TaxID=1117310 RepID=A0A9N8WIC3_9GLOM|nr:1541_t:CDS:2 [Funneliformis caledonium]
MGRKNAKTPQLGRTVKRFHRQTMKKYLRDFKNGGEFYKIINQVLLNLVTEAKHREELEKEEQRIISRNELGSYVFNLRNKLDVNKLYIPNRLNDAIQETIAWLVSNQEASKEEYENKQGTLKEIANPITRIFFGETDVSGSRRGDAG